MTYFPKNKYGVSTATQCTHCESVAIVKSADGFPLCRDHKNEPSPQWLCPCTQPLYPHESKHGVFFLCMDCGPVSFAKAKDFNTTRVPGVKWNINKNARKRLGV